MHSKVFPNNGNDAEELSTDSDSISAELQSCETMSQDAIDIGIDESCEVPEVAFEPVVKWHKSDWDTYPGFKDIMSTPIVASLNDDNGDGVIDREDIPDIVVVAGGGLGSYAALRAISGEDGSELWSQLAEFNISSGLAVGDIDNDGLVEIIAPGLQGFVTAYSNTGTVKWSIREYSAFEWGGGNAASIADLNADGNPEVIVGKAIISGTGTTIGVGEHGSGSSAARGSISSVADVNLDGFQNVIVGNAIYNHDGSTLCHNEQEDGLTAIGNFNDDPMAEIVVVSEEGEVRLQDAHCNVLWETQIPGASLYFDGGTPTIADYDGDGHPEIGIATTNTYTVLNDDGSVLWQNNTTDVSSGMTGSSVFDFEGDGIVEVVYADEESVWIFNGPDGEVKKEYQQHSSGTWSEYAVVVDVDADDHAEIVIAHNSISGGTHSGLTVLEDAHDSWQAGRRIWNQHTYSITNVDENGAIPAYPEPNWLSYNNFRSGNLSAVSGSMKADLYGEVTQVCTDECEEDMLYVLVNVGNQGTIDVDVPVVVDLWGIREDGTKELFTQYTIEDIIPSGFQLAGMNLEIKRSDLQEFERLQVVVDSTGVVAECDESNNYAEYDKGLCIQ